MSLDADIESVDYYATEGTVIDGPVEVGRAFSLASKVIVDFESHQYDTTANLQTGLTWHFTEMIQLYGDMGYTTDFTDYNSYRLDFGFRLMW